MGKKVRKLGRGDRKEKCKREVKVVKKMHNDTLQKSGPHSCMMNIPGGMRRTGSGDYFVDMFWHG